MKMSGEYRIILQHAVVKNICFITSPKHNFCQGMFQQLQDFYLIKTAMPKETVKETLCITSRLDLRFLQ